jgi:hypothetical protein
MWLSSEGGKNMIVAKVNKAVPGELKIDELSMGWFSGVKVSKLDFSDQKGCTKITATSWPLARIIWICLPAEFLLAMLL